MKNNTGQANKATIWFIVGFIVVVTAGAIIAGAYSSGTASSSNSNTASSTFVATIAPAITATDWTEGNPNAKVSLIEYGDFECPACGEYFPIVEQLVQNYSSTVQFVFRNFPLYTIHPFAGISAQAAEAAGLEGGVAKYWAMNGLLYTKQSEWSLNSALTPQQVLSQYLDGYAQSLGLDVNTFNNDINATSVMQKIQTDVSGGTTAQIDHTPTFFVNLKQIPNPTSLQDFENTLNAAIASSSASSSLAH
ncbi:MAG: thioredoxin domain-containing protein [Minisyncoccia bacterium]|jgi:protein-disulfide isomerase